MEIREALTPRFLLADDHEMVRLALRHALAPIAASIEWCEAADAAAVETALATNGNFDLALVDLHMPGSSGAAWITQLRNRFPVLPLIVMSGDESTALVRELIRAGVAAFIPKSDSPSVILQAVRLVLSGGTYVPLRLLAMGAVAPAPTGDTGNPGLTRRQLEVLQLLAKGWPNKLIARELGLSEGTVKVHLLAIFRALDARNRTEAVVAAQKRLQADGRAMTEPPGAPRDG